MHVSGLFRYPVKSLRGHALPAAALEPRGLAGDRRWLVVDPRNRFVTRREAPQMAHLDVTMEPDSLTLHHPDLPPHSVAIPAPDAPEIEATIWRDTVRLRLADDATAAWLSAALARPVRLAYQGDDSIRPVDPHYARGHEHVSMADGYPLLVTTEASLAALNDALEVTVPMARFRPNLVIAGGEPWAEYGWDRLRIGGVTLRITRPCTRCVITTQHVLTGERHEGNEPLTTLRTLSRTVKDGVLFGQNAVPEQLGEIAVGDPVEAF